MSDQRKRWNLRFALTLVAIASFSAVAIGVGSLGCGHEEEEETQENQNNDDPPPRPKDNDEGWEVETVPFEEDAGFRLRLAVSDDGTVGLGFFEMVPVTGEPCEELEIEDPPNRILWTLHYMEQQPGGDWHGEVVQAEPYQGSPQGLALDYDHDGRAVMVTMTGEPVSQLVEYCGVNDVGVFTRQSDGDWSHETAVSESGEAATGHPAADAGYVVGYHPGLAFDSEGQPAVAYRDVHFGGLQLDDTRRADLEFVHRNGGSWQPEAVDWADGAGMYNQLVFDDDDRPIIAHYAPTESRLEERLGYWVMWRVEDEWQEVQLFNRANSEEPSIALHPETGDLHFLYYDSEFGTPRMASLSDWEAFESASAWEHTDSTEIGDPTYDEGYSPSLAISPDGTLAAAYYRCNVASQGLGDCTPEESAVVFAYLDGDEWVQEEVDSGADLAFCGQVPSLAFDGDEPLISYRCEVYEDEELSTEVRVARRDSID